MSTIIRIKMAKRDIDSKGSENHASKKRNRSRQSDSLDLRHRSNITVARLQDASFTQLPVGPSGRRCKGLLTKEPQKILNVVELFAGAGGMGLGFLLGRRANRRFRLVFSGEINPIYVETLRRNLRYYSRIEKGSDHSDSADIKPIDLDSRNAINVVSSSVRNAGGVDILIGGPPCQGFSSANRNSWSADNPNNRLVNVFMEYVNELKPRIFLMENVQGIAWTSRNRRGNTLSVAEHILRKTRALGYLVFPKLLDAVWYGVPQYRTRFFVLGIHEDIGYTKDDFGDWGPFPTPTHGPTTARPFVTIREAIGDLPTIGNGHDLDQMNYEESVKENRNRFLDFVRTGALRKRILDHVTSRHADYVIERYKRIPAGGNWQDIAEMMSNYTRLERTHSNIYRRLEWDLPSITIGHYRKSMLIHPTEHRGLSLREACRLQSFPDWFRFAGTLNGSSGGLMHKQQQLANAVCPLVSRAIAEVLLEL